MTRESRSRKTRLQFRLGDSLFPAEPSCRNKGAAYQAGNNVNLTGGVSISLSRKLCSPAFATGASSAAVPTISSIAKTTARTLRLGPGFVHIDGASTELRAI